MRTLWTRTWTLGRWDATVALEAKLADAWVGAFGRRREEPEEGFDLWVCLVPCFPVHVMVEPWGEKTTMTTQEAVSRLRGRWAAWWAPMDLSGLWTAPWKRPPLKRRPRTPPRRLQLPRLPARPQPSRHRHATREPPMTDDDDRPSYPHRPKQQWPPQARALAVQALEQTRHTAGAAALLDVLDTWMNQAIRAIITIDHAMRTAAQHTNDAT